MYLALEDLALVTFQAMSDKVWKFGIRNPFLRRLGLKSIQNGVEYI